MKFASSKSVRALDEKEQERWTRLQPRLNAYEGLKVLLKKKFGSGDGFVAAVEKIKKEPSSDGQMQVLKEEVEAAKAERTIEHLGAALTVYTREAFPADWARTQSNLGLAYSNDTRRDIL